MAAGQARLFSQRAGMGCVVVRRRVVAFKVVALKIVSMNRGIAEPKDRPERTTNV
jgi:hypothetical protein